MGIYCILLCLSFLFCFIVGMRMVSIHRAARTEWINVCPGLEPGLVGGVTQ